MDVYIKKLLLTFEINKYKFTSVKEKERISEIIKKITYSKINNILDEAFKNFIKKNPMIDNLLEITTPIKIHIDYNFSNNNTEIIQNSIQSQLTDAIIKNLNRSVDYYTEIHKKNKNTINIEQAVSILQNIKGEKDIEFCENNLNIKELYSNIISSNMVKSLYYNIKNNIALDFIYSKIDNNQKEETIKILFKKNFKDIETLKEEILNYKNILFLENIPNETIKKIF